MISARALAQYDVDRGVCISVRHANLKQGIVPARNTRVTVSAAPNVRSTDTDSLPWAGCDHTKCRSSLSLSSQSPGPSPVLFHNRHRTCFPQGSPLRNLDTSSPFPVVNHLPPIWSFLAEVSRSPTPFIGGLSSRLCGGLRVPSGESCL